LVEDLTPGLTPITSSIDLLIGRIRVFHAVRGQERRLGTELEERGLVVGASFEDEVLSTCSQVPTLKLRAGSENVGSQLGRGWLKELARQELTSTFLPASFEPRWLEALSVEADSILGATIVIQGSG